MEPGDNSQLSPRHLISCQCLKKQTKYDTWGGWTNMYNKINSPPLGDKQYILGGRYFREASQTKSIHRKHSNITTQAQFLRINMLQRLSIILFIISAVKASATMHRHHIILIITGRRLHTVLYNFSDLNSRNLLRCPWMTWTWIIYSRFCERFPPSRCALWHICCIGVSLWNMVQASKSDIVPITLIAPKKINMVLCAS